VAGAAFVLQQSLGEERAEHAAGELGEDVHDRVHRVDPAQRRGGAGRMLTEAVLDWARQEGFQVIELWVAEGNDRAAKLYERCGFAATGTRRPLPSDPARAAIEMARAL
jgi:ribosomal protein S18 acetylase RimI-like enzyme